ncbi:hypothetical protein RUM43_000762 [Polyplax serrata]|uniref:Uncharacterized protein n=1 Tax=Polyplax serrata TaxID=468196 RepID=A0AAN8SHN8_POLSC
MASAGGPKQEEAKTLEKRSKDHVDCTKEDGIRKELYKIELKAQENWEGKWGFLKNQHKLVEEEAAKMGLSRNPTKERKKKEEHISPFLKEVTSPEKYNFTIKRLPILSSGLIGWTSAAAENNLDKLTGRLYISRKETMKPPLQSDEPDLAQQRFIVLG